MASKSTTKQLVELNSNGRVCLATIFDMFGQVTYRAEQGRPATMHLSVLGIPATLVHWFESAYGGERIRNGWRVKGVESDLFAREIRYFAPRMHPQLDTYLEGRKLIGAKKPIRIKDRWVARPLSERDVSRRRTITKQLAELERQRQQSSCDALPFPPIFLKRQS